MWKFILIENNLCNSFVLSSLRLYLYGFLKLNLKNDLLFLCNRWTKCFKFDLWYVIVYIGSLFTNNYLFDLLLTYLVINRNLKVLNDHHLKIFVIDLFFLPDSIPGCIGCSMFSWSTGSSLLGQWCVLHANEMLTCLVRSAWLVTNKLMVYFSCGCITN